MLSLSYADMSECVDDIVERCKNMKPAPLRFYSYLHRVLEWDKSHSSIKFPCDIKIPKPNKYLLKGDLEPLQVIHMEEPPVMDDGEPFWCNSAAKQMYLRFGFENLDAREVCRLKMDGEFIHAFLGGSSGHGKSVTLNSMIGAICYEYAPWEVEIHLSDAKIVEFKKYGVGHRIPHIASIAATGDPDFVISVLSRAKREMEERQKIFGSINVSNLKNFREKTGLCLPRVVIIMDEVESTFRLAGRQADKIGSLIDDFARLGRATGYHIFMATQNMSSDIPKSAVGQIRIRACLGANETVSQAVLGNSGATDNFGRIGRLIVNTEVMNGGKTAQYNVKFQTPLLEDYEFEDEMKFLEAEGNKYGFHRNLAFYDEEDIKTVERFDPVIDKSIKRMQASQEITPSRTPIILGYPSFVVDDEDELLKIWLDGKDVENILITSAASEHTAAHLHNITKSLAMCGYVVQLFTTDMDIAQWVYKPAVAVEARNADKPPLSTIGSLVRKRLFLLQLDAMAKSATYERTKVEKVFEADGIPRELWGNDIQCRRVVAYNTLLAKNNKEWDDIRYLFPTYKEVFLEFDKARARTSEINPSNFAKAAFVVGDLSKIVGYGRDTREAKISIIKKAAQDACRVGVFFLFFTRSMEGLTSMVSAIRYAIFDLPDGKEWGRLRADEPRELRPMLALLNDNLDSEMPQKKFKRTLLKEEF